MALEPLTIGILTLDCHDIDDKVLVQMSSANDIKSKDERDRYVVGLKQIIADLRTKGVKEFNKVAHELAAYRRRFREEQDPSLVLPS